ncbi:MAG: carbohydrate-binding protein [Acidobacteriota bacterium]|nr:carbohydrate-binding protein [Acidobacteriota bacterium]
MRKSIVSPTPATNAAKLEIWRDLERIARVEITSEDVEFPIEHALGKTSTSGWRAATPGPQVIRMHFDEPFNIRRIQLHFVDPSTARSQEFVLLAGQGKDLREIVRQQWSFSPTGSTEELEDYNVELEGITTLELQIDPDRSHDPNQSQSHATLQSLKLA